jgi:hypothetical protein
MLLRSRSQLYGAMLCTALDGIHHKPQCKNTSALTCITTTTCMHGCMPTAA